MADVANTLLLDYQPDGRQKENWKAAFHKGVF